jgi:ankyrin repeat protein
MSGTYRRVMAELEAGTAERWEALATELPGFPDGVDDLLGRKWIMNALGSGSAASVQWMLRKGVALDFRDEEGYTPVHAAIERRAADRYELLEQLLQAGAPVNLKGINDWTPAHLAAARDDVEALRILIRHGADLSLKTDIDDYATPLEEARHLGRTNAVRYLEALEARTKPST